jgi:hypothetical protein
MITLVYITKLCDHRMLHVHERAACHDAKVVCTSHHPQRPWQRKCCRCHDVRAWKCGNLRIPGPEISLAVALCLLDMERLILLNKLAVKTAKTAVGSEINQKDAP